MIARVSQWTAAEVAAAVGGTLVGRPDQPIAGVSTDTRDPLQNQLFVALVGERFDAHDFLPAAQEAGAACLLVSREVDAPSAVVVPDTLFALGELAKAHRKRMPAKVVALTGSNGKTTTKEMLAAIFAEGRRTLKTEGNLNNLIGLPMTILGLQPDHEVLVLEMGMNQPGEIARYTEIADPDVGMVINVGPAHIGMLGSLQAIADAKGELYAEMREDAVRVVNADDPEVVRVNGGTPAVTFGASGDVRLRASTPASNGQQIVVEVGDETVELTLPFAGRHNAMNATAAIAAAHAFGAPAAWARTGLPKASQAAGRLVFEEIGPWLVVDDCYNANLASMAAALQTVGARAKADGRRLVALLGEMRELGDFSAEQHAEVGRLAKQHADVVAAFGPLAAPMEAQLYEAEDVEALFRRISLQSGDVILVKGSRGIRMERFIALLRAKAGA